MRKSQIEDSLNDICVVIKEIGKAVEANAKLLEGILSLIKSDMELERKGRLRGNPPYIQ